METKEAKKLDFDINGKPVEVRIYEHAGTHSTRTEFLGLDLNRPLNITELYALQDLVAQAIFMADGMEDRL